MSNDARGISVLLVVSDRETEESLCRELERRVKSVEVKRNVEEAMGYFSNNKTPVVFIDDSISVKNRLALVKEFCWENPEVLIALTVESGKEKEAMDAVNAGASDLVRKPLDLVNLSDLLSRFASSYSRFQYKQFVPEMFKEAKMSLSVLPTTKAVADSVLLLSRFFSVVFNQRELKRIELGLQEVLRNSLEHGSLGIDYAKKTELCESAEFDSFVEASSKKACEDNKVIKVEAEYIGGIARISVLDDGDGFDWRSMKKELEEKPVEGRFNGRGLILIELVFDKVSYNEKGNETILEISIAE